MQPSCVPVLAAVGRGQRDPGNLPAATCTGHSASADALLLAAQHVMSGCSRAHALRIPAGKVLHPPCLITFDLACSAQCVVARLSDLNGVCTGCPQPAC